MKLNIQLAVAIFLFLTVGSVSANWRYYTDDIQTGDKFFYEPSRVKRDGNLVTVWERIEYSNSTRIKTLKIQVDCKKELARILFIHDEYMGKSDMIENSEQETKFSSIQPNTIFDKLRIAVCKK